MAKNCFACTRPSCANAPWMSRGFIWLAHLLPQEHITRRWSPEKDCSSFTRQIKLACHSRSPCALTGVWLFNMQQITRPKQARCSWWTSVLSTPPAVLALSQTSSRFLSNQQSVSSDSENTYMTLTFYPQIKASANVCEYKHLINHASCYDY